MNIKTTKTFSIKAGIRGLLLSVACLSTVSWADDTEIFFGRASSIDDSNPNLLFILDSSGSMVEKDGGDLSRMDRLKEAMTALIDQSSSFNVGFMSFNGSNQGGPIRYPIGYLEGVSGTECPDSGCPDELVVSRPRISTDDAVENDITNVVTLGGPNLVIGDLTDTTTTTTIPPDAVLIPGEAALLASVAEYVRNSDNLVFNKNDQANDTWFDPGLPDHTAQIMGYRFGTVDIPKGAIITDASIEFMYSTIGIQSGDVSAYLSAEAIGTPEQYPDESQIPTPDPYQQVADRTLTSEFVSWPDIPMGLGGEIIATPDLTAVLQEVIGLPGWASGNEVSLVVEAYDSYTPEAANQRVFHGIGGTALQKPVLKYTYYIPTDSSIGTETDIAVSYMQEAFKPSDLSYPNETTALEADLFYSDPELEAATLALQFDAVDIPNNAIITGAYLTMTDMGGTGTFTANLSGELSNNSKSFAIEQLNTRTSTTKFVEWPLADGAAVAEISSPDIAIVLEEIRDLPGWGSGKPITLFLKAGTDYVHDGTMIRKIATSASSTPPILTVSWKTDDTTTVITDPTQTVGLRFPSIHVPPEATIVSATLEFHSHAASDTPASFNIRGEAINSAPSFTSVDGDITGRSKTVAGTTWTADPWNTVGTKFTSISVAGIVQELVDQPDWCGGNAIAMLLDGTGTRDAVSYEGSSVNAPTLRITYSPDSVTTGAYCSNRSSIVAIEEDEDDGHELASNAVLLGSVAIPLVDASNNKSDIALRFRGVPLPQGAELVNAVIELTAAADITAGNQAQIYIDNAVDSAQLIANDDNISDRISGADITWSAIPAALTGETIFTPDISSLLQNKINDTNWSEGNSVTLVIKPTTGTSAVNFASHEGGEALAAKLILYYEGERTAPGTLFKENLKVAIDELVAYHGTPIVDAYLEATNYFLGRAVDYGDHRGHQGSGAENYRVSHPFSYTGGTIDRDNDCTDADLNNSDCRDEEIDGSPTYISPIDNQCQQNHIILLSDGEATSNSAASKIRALTGGTCSMADDDWTDQACGRELAAWLSASDHDALLPGTQNIITHTVGFNLTEPQFLKDLATEGGGDFYPASTSAELLNVFKTIFNSVSKSDVSFVAPSASINQFNRLKNREDVYFALFKPEATARWPGNLKRYKLQGGTNGSALLVDQTGATVIDATTGEFNASSRSFWSGENDGGNVTKGGAAAELEGNTARNIVTYTATANVNLLDAINDFSVTNTNISLADFELLPETAADTNYVNDLKNWTAGFDVEDEDGDGNTTENRIHMGDPMHSQPLVVNYTPDTEGGVKSVIYVATNEGYLHAINQDDGTERFAFIPRELFKNLRYFYANEVTDNRRYGLDGNITSWIKDINNNGVVDSAAGDKAYIYFGMRRGGRDYYALDVTNPAAPKFKWHISSKAEVNDSNPTTANGNWTGLGQSWSTPIVTKIKHLGAIKDVLIFGGGYDPNNHDQVGDLDPGIDISTGERKVDTLGASVYIADAETGELLWKTDTSSTAFNDMQFSIVSDIRVIDINSDGLADQAYVGDLGGQIWRFDFDTGDNAALTLSGRIHGGLVADFHNTGSVNRRRFYNTPDLSVVNVEGKPYLSLSVGSGWRAHPLDDIVQDRFYTFRMPAVFGPPLDTMGQIVYTEISETTTGMVDVTDTLGSDPTTSIGWYLDLELTGEKVLGSSLTLDNEVIFTSYVPSSSLDACAAAVGYGKLYKVSALNGDPVADLDANSAADDGTGYGKGDRSKTLPKSGIPTPVSVFFPEGGTISVMTNGTSIGGIDQDPMTMTYWQEIMDDN